jgi:hypothetical protein
MLCMAVPTYLGWGPWPPQDIVRSLAEHMAKLPDLSGILLSLHPLNATADTVDGEPS